MATHHPSIIAQPPKATPTITVSNALGQSAGETTMIKFTDTPGADNIASPTPSRSKSVDMDTVMDAYRQRYAAYLASTFHISVEAATSEALYQLQPRRRSEYSEAEIYRD
ncbi:hypothetical protein H2198_000748 [Neophaeococcomyces mojaviensis]|uniref:Uncharacterized protein n=1 Tax=Neophaeococcomyces mojaviensis TaxID=3383035 RepID=A0ACC3AJE1_9EURO|nr:hypothetical protein H2198_000748 [Knufia sp. JES_112]